MAKNTAGKNFFFKGIAKIVFLSFLALFLIRTFLIESYSITSASMEGNLLVGDKIFISKLHYGPRLPAALKLPMMSGNKNVLMRMLGMKPYPDIPPLPYFRLPGFTRVQRNDVIAFNLPPEQFPSYDLKTVYVKRCVALPGDTVEMRQGMLYIDGRREQPKQNYMYAYSLHCSSLLNIGNTASWGLRDYSNQLYALETMLDGKDYRYTLFADSATLARVTADPRVRHWEPMLGSDSYNDLDIYPHLAALHWNKDRMGPLIIPAKGMTVLMDSAHAPLYFPILKGYEGIRDCRLSGHQIFIDGRPISAYSFKNDYYFAMGDNRGASFDSRYWGPVPENHIIGKAVAIWYATDGGPTLQTNF
ncbi:signal peptidase I [Puia sp.]|jgi:signal peptidase I|uniref:signal peptidase I n=1 Tax=Puia sp. TaxID=2045100 RepID=UPI002F3E8DBD